MKYLAIIFSVLLLSCGGDKPNNNPPVGFGGITLPTVSLGYLRRCDNGVTYLPEDQQYPFNGTSAEDKALRQQIEQTVCDAVAHERRIAVQHGLTPPLASDYRVMCIEPMAFTEDGLPAILVTPMGATKGGSVPIGQPVKTAGTVLNTSRSNVPVAGGQSVPFIVLACQEKWDQLNYLFNVVWFEGEHLDERWQSYDLFMSYSGANDVHEHRKDWKAPERSKYKRLEVLSVQSDEERLRNLPRPTKENPVVVVEIPQ